MSMRIDWRYLLIGLLAYLVFLVVQFPADRAYAWWKAGPGAGQPVVLSGLSGSVWQGRAAQARIGKQHLRGLAWRLRPWAVLGGRLALDLDLRLEDGFARGSLSATPDGGIAVDRLEAKLSLSQLAIEALAALRPSGVINLNLHDVAWDGQALLSAGGRVVWSDAGINLFQPLRFGDLAVTLETREDAVVARLGDAGGPLQADGLLTLRPDGSYQFSGSLAAREGPRTPLGRALASLGRPGADGRIQVSRSGNLADLGLSTRRE